MAVVAQLQSSLKGGFSTVTVPLPSCPLPNTAAVKFSRRRRVLTFTCACCTSPEVDVAPNAIQQRHGGQQFNARSVQHREMSPAAQRQARELLYGIDDLPPVLAISQASAPDPAETHPGGDESAAAQQSCRSELGSSVPCVAPESRPCGADEIRLSAPCLEASAYTSESEEPVLRCCT